VGTISPAEDPHHLDGRLQHRSGAR
jgi:hypothetical protein